jgi:hypothetical protein
VLDYNFTHLVTTGARARARARGNGHRRRVSQACPAVYETIEEEERSSPPTPAAASAVAIKKTDGCDDVYVVEPCAVDSIWDDEQGILILQKYYALRDEAETTVMESRRIWEDTPFSLFAVQCTFSLSLDGVLSCSFFFHKLFTRLTIGLGCRRSWITRCRIMDRCLPIFCRVGFALELTLDRRRILLAVESRLLPPIRPFRGVESHLLPPINGVESRL